MGFLILNKVTLKGRHLIFTENRRIRSRPDIPDVILCLAHLCRIILRIVAFPGIIIENII